MAKCQVLFYEDGNGGHPGREFLDTLDAKMRAKAETRLMQLSDNGRDLRGPYSVPLGDGIFELRAQVATNISRVLYFFIIGNKAVVTHGFIKKTQKTPPEEIEKAKKHRKIFLEKEKL